MKTNIKENNTVKIALKKIGLLVLFLTILVLNEACQHTAPKEVFNVIVQDEIRKNHSKELLKKALNKSSLANIKSFDGDVRFHQYISHYLKKNNKKINADKFTQTLMNLSKSHAYDPILILAVIKTESSFNFNAIGGAGEIGLMQIKPKTAEWICNKKNIKWMGKKALKDPEYNILVGAHYLKYLMQTLNSQSMKYINAYNMGPASLKRTPSAELKKHPYFGKVTRNYLAIYSELKKIKEKKAI